MRRFSARAATRFVVPLPSAAPRIPRRFSWYANLQKAKGPKLEKVELDTAAASQGIPDPEFAPSARNQTLSRWLFGSCGVVAGIVVVGGITRLTESGLSITDWKPLRGILPPITREQWEEEFERYKQFPEYKQKHDGMDMAEFQFIFFWEWFHRVLARSMGIVYGAPLVYFSARGYFKGHRALQAKLFGILGLGGMQGAVGWWMVQSGLDHSLLDEKKKATVSAYRLSTHLTIALTIYASMLRLAFSLRVAPASVHIGPYGPLRLAVRVATGSMLATAITGACTAALDAGLLYCDTFPWMGDQLLPSPQELFAHSPLYRNIFENGTAAQTAHRLLAANTLWAVLAVNIIARRPHFAKCLTPSMKRAIKTVNHAVAFQALLGVATVMTYVSLPVAVVHQGNSLVLLAALIKLCAVFGSRGVVL